MNKIEKIKGEHDGLDVGADTPRFAELGREAINDGDRERLKCPVQAAPRTVPAALRAEG